MESPVIKNCYNYFTSSDDVLTDSVTRLSSGHLNM